MGREQASALNKEQVAPSGAAGGLPWHLSPLFDAEKWEFNGAEPTACAFAAQGFGSPCVKKCSQGLFRNVGRTVQYIDS